MTGVSNLLNIGNNAVRANQVAINTTGNNIANSNTAGYVRQSVRFQESTPFDYRPGQIGTGAYAQEIYRNFDRYLENNYLSQNGLFNMWNEESVIMQTVQSTFNEANTDGIHDQLSNFLQAWTKLSTNPGSTAVREDIISKTQNLTMLYQNANKALADTKREMNEYINLAISDVNEIIDKLADVNQEISKSYNPPSNNCNSLLDKRDALVRELSTLVDVSVQDKGPRDFKVYL
ncbi:MAG: flagellar hook-associated protein FlgK, partial [Mailhella sp.]|nr:flagellar hook-associated protein FlgK [Mailhella sp.]